MKKFIFIDRDGTMGGDHTVIFPQDYYHYDYTREALAILKEKGFFIIIVTNQSCIARGLDNDYDFAKEFQDIGADDWFICPHDEQDNCECRKPKSGLLIQAQNRYDINFNASYMVGDRWSDMIAGGNVGTKVIPVLTGRGEETIGIHRHKWSGIEPEFVASNLLEAAKKL